MQIDKYLEKYQPVIHKTFSNALTSNKLSHAYLLSGSIGMPLKQAAIYLAKSLVCDEPNPLACNNCITCARIDEETYSDFFLFDGEAGTIKKNQVEKIMKNFDKTARETKGVMIYVLHLVETMTPSAVNALLKFLEEPGNNIFAFLTTENEAMVLPTIVSRTQVLRFKEIDRNQVIDDAVNNGVPIEDAEILSGFCSDSELIKGILESKEYEISKSCLKQFMDAIIESPARAIYVNQKEIDSVIKTQDIARLYIKMLIEVFRDLVNLSVNTNITLKSYANILGEMLPHLANVNKSLLTIMSAVNKLDSNVNIALLLDHITYEITKEGK